MSHNDHPLAEHIERLANELQLTRQVLDEIRTEIQWAVQNCCRRIDPADSTRWPAPRKAVESSLSLLPTFDEGDAVVLRRNGEEIFGEVVTINDAENLAEVLLIPSNATITVIQDELSRIDPDTLRRRCTEPGSCVIPDAATVPDSAAVTPTAPNGRLF
ncbi:MAG: hypothetical protein R3C59_09955 [Planctomycetaceae bacterium]